MHFLPGHLVSMTPESGKHAETCHENNKANNVPLFFSLLFRSVGCYLLSQRRDCQTNNCRAGANNCAQFTQWQSPPKAKARGRGKEKGRKQSTEGCKTMWPTPLQKELPHGQAEHLYQRLLLIFPEIFLGCPAFRAHPVGGNLLPGSSRFNTMFVITFFRIIDISARTFPFLHTFLLRKNLNRHCTFRLI